MKKVVIGIVVLVVLAVAYWLISPLFIDKKVSEELPTQTQNTETILTGSFEGFDKIHYGSGTVSIIETDGEPTIIRFEENFNVANGPDLYVGLGRDGEYVKGTEIAKLKGNVGSQNYVLPSDLNLDDYNEVWIWCRAFSVGFARASLGKL